MMGSGLLVSKTGIKRFLQKNGMRVSEAAYTAINEKTKVALTNAVKRAKANKRSTVMERDL
jgi:histone H3/H4